MSAGGESTRVALVTGGAGGIGRGVAGALLARGFRVAIADLEADAAQAAATELCQGDAEAIGVSLDVTAADSVAAAIAETGGRLGPVDTLVNNAGWDELKPFTETDEAFWGRVVEVNYMGALRVTHALLPGMLERGFGRVVSVSSDAARVGSSLEAVYAGAKAALIGFTKSLAREVARAGVTANVVCPGPTQTPMLATITAADERGAGVIDAMTRAVPMKRLGTPADVASAVAFFASEEAGYLTGQTLSVSGGLTMA
jgi:2-hydroxycyclohexanecarboxyl-CoA dehydrogenase